MARPPIAATPGADRPKNAVQLSIEILLASSAEALIFR
jgi:hypothetical protein